LTINVKIDASTAINTSNSGASTVICVRIRILEILEIHFAAMERSFWHEALNSPNRGAFTLFFKSLLSATTHQSPGPVVPKEERHVLLEV